MLLEQFVGEPFEAADLASGRAVLWESQMLATGRMAVFSRCHSFRIAHPSSKIPPDHPPLPQPPRHGWGID